MIISTIVKIILLIVVALTAIGYYINKGPNQSTYLIENFKYNSISINYDDFGVPHIKSQTFHDVLFGLGFVQAKDRSYMLQTLSSESKENIQAYADGVNEYVSRLSVLPLEFQVTGAKFHEYTIIDSLAFIKTLNIQLTLDYSQEVLREQFKQAYGKEAADFIMANNQIGLIDDTTIMNDVELKQMKLYQKFNETFTEINEQFFLDIEKQILQQNKNNQSKTQQINKNQMPGQAGQQGSNAWAISGQHTKSGKPLLANDPHLDNSMPSVWQLVTLEFQDDKGVPQILQGGSMPCGAGIFSGRTNHFAFGVTTLYADVSDLLTVTEKDGKYLYDGFYHFYKKINEIISVKGQKDHKLQLDITNHGPVLTPGVLPMLEQKVSFRWPGNYPNDTTYDGIYKLLKAKTVEEMENSLHLISGPPQAIVWASVNGDIGFFGNGRIPKRKSYKTQGYILDGSQPENDWLGFVPKNEQPRLVNPQKGYVVVGNNKFATDNIVNQISTNVQTTARGKRITEMIQQKIDKKQKFDTSYMKIIQSDVQDSYYKPLIPDIVFLIQKYQNVFTLTLEEKQILVQIKQYIEKWDGKYTVDSVAASFIQVWQSQMQKNFFHKGFENKEEYREILTTTKQYLYSGLNTVFCQTKETDQYSNNLACPNQFIHAFINAYYIMAERFQTTDLSKFTYGSLHSHIYPHKLYSHIPILNQLFSRSYPGFGNQNTIHVSGTDFREEKFDGSHAANFKTVISMDYSDKSYWIVDTGNSENIFSPHYDDQQELYKKHQYLEMNRKQRRSENTIKIFKKPKQIDL